jgi:hypothetical protein
VDIQHDWKKLLKADPTNWLLEPDDPGVRYLALRDMVEASKKEVKVARRRAHKEGPIAKILDKMNPEGYWVKPGPGYLPKVKSIVWCLISLAQMGASIEEDKRVRTACAYYLDHALVKGGQFTPNGKITDVGLCLQGNMLASLMELGCEDKRLEKAYEWTARRLTGDNLPRKINDDGLTPAEAIEGPFRNVKFITDPLFGCRTNEGMACAWAGVNVMLAFSQLPPEKRTNLIKRAINLGIDFFLDVDTASAAFPGHRNGTPNPVWWQFVFPAFGGDMLRIAEAFTALGYGKDPRLAKTLNFIREKQDEKGRWPYEYPDSLKHKMWVICGEYGQPNKWVTLRVMRMLKRAEMQKVT